MTFDRDYAGCIIPVAEVRAGVGKPCGERDDANLKKSGGQYYTEGNRLFLQF